MDLSNIQIRQNRYSTYGWSDFDNKTNQYKNTLNQGEIGILLGSYGEPVDIPNSGKELNSILEVRIGSQDNQYFFDATLLSTSAAEVIDYSIKTFPTYNALPAFGNINSLYVVKDENAIYRWNDDISKMVRVTGDSDWHDIERIDGGNSSSGSTQIEI